MKRDILVEIQTLKNRSNDYSVYLYNARLETLHNNYNSIVKNELDKEFLKYIPIAIVACFESFFQSVISNLIDFGNPYINNVVKFNQSKDVKFDFDIVNAIQSKTLTIGEFISHVLPCNNLNDINSNISVIINKDFLNELAKFKAKSVHKDVVKNSEDFIKDPDSIYKSIKRIFELRHIFCHEFAYNFHIENKEILECLQASELFLNQTNRFIEELLYPNSPETQTEINIYSYEKFLEKEKELDDLVKLIKEANTGNFYSFDNELFDKMIEKWKDYRENKALVDAYINRGGSIYSYRISSSNLYMTNLKIESLRITYNNMITEYLSKKLG
ncbi:MAG: hypothetical protein JWP94_2404 [Mucilaginibacter sp.]|nr:hypothetical protein [Mucilaginibacter sp.]